MWSYLFLFLACFKSPSAIQQTTSLKKSPQSANFRPETFTKAFGDQRWGFVETYSSNGRLVVLRLFEGNKRPRFGQHGEPLDGEPTIVLYDLFKETQLVLQNIWGKSSSGRWLGIKTNGAWQIIDSYTGKPHTLPDISTENDENRCLLNRMSKFAVNSDRIGWINQQSSALHVWDLEQDKKWTLKGKGKIWRGWPDDSQKGATVLEISNTATAWPKQRTSCACLSCNRFAHSYGVYGWSGPKFKISHIAEDGSRQPASPASKRNFRPLTCKLRAMIDEKRMGKGPWMWHCPQNQN